MPGHKDWLDKASGDLKSSKKLIRDDDDTLDTAAYHAHQCAEKALKAYFVFLNKQVPKSHDLEFLLKSCIEFDLEFVSLKQEIIDLNPYVTESRYPDDQFVIDREEVEAAIKKATKVLNCVKKKLEATSDQNLRIY